MDENSRLEHNAEQARHFDTRIDLFRQPIPDSIQARTRSIVRAARLDRNATVLDVGTGLGVLIPYLLEQGVLADNIVGCDLSRSMLAVARSRFPSVRFWQGDFLDLPPMRLGREQPQGSLFLYGNLFQCLLRESLRFGDGRRSSCAIVSTEGTYSHQPSSGFRFCRSTTCRPAGRRTESSSQAGRT